MSTAEKFLSCLDKVKPTGRGKWMACCPAHDDNTPSLSIKETEGGDLLLHCFAGCSAADVVAAVGFTLSDLFDAPRIITSGAATGGRPCRPRTCCGPWQRTRC